MSKKEKEKKNLLDKNLIKKEEKNNIVINNASDDKSFFDQKETSKDLEKKQINENLNDNKPDDQPKETKTISDETNLKVDEDLNKDENLDFSSVEETSNIITENLVKEKMQQINEASKPKNKRKSTLTSLLLLAINLIIVYFIAATLFSEAEDASITNLINVQGDKLKVLWWCVLLFAISMIADALLIFILLRSNAKKSSLWLSYRTSAIGKYYEAITPLSAGGQPSQVLYLAKRKVSPGVATSIPVIRVTLLNFCTIIFAVLLFFFVAPKVNSTNVLTDILTGVLKLFAYIGVFVNVLYLLLIVIMATNKIFGRTLARSIIRLGYRMRIIKNYRKSYSKLIGQVTEFQNSISYLGKNVWLFIGSVILIFIQILAIATIPMVVTISLSGISFLTTRALFTFWIQCVALYYICYMASAFIPLPGGTGMMEISFVILFGQYMNPNFVVWAFLIWRLVSYYINILQGIILTIGDTVASSIGKKQKTNEKIEV